MNKTYVFDFYNLYIRKGKKYENKKLGIRITPLKGGEEFQKKRKKITEPYYYNDYIIAKCFIHSKNAENAEKLAGWIEFLYSFAQSRPVYYLKRYEYKSGKKYYSRTSKRIIQKNNGSAELISGVNVFDKDIGLFIDTALNNLCEMDESKLNTNLIVLDAYLYSISELPIELKFLSCWLALEKLLLQQKFKKSVKIEKLEKIENQISNFLDTIQIPKKEISSLKKNIHMTLLYETKTIFKIIKYLEYLDSGFNEKNLKKILPNLILIRVKLVHYLDSSYLKNDLRMLDYIELILEVIILRILGIDKQLQKKIRFRNYHFLKSI